MDDAKEMYDVGTEQKSIEEQKKIQIAIGKMKSYCKEHKIFMDTCSLLHFASGLFWENIIPLLEQYQNKIIIPHRCIEELKKHSQNEEDEELATNAKACIGRLSKLVDEGYVEIRGEAGDNFADNVFQVVFTKFRMKYKLMLITQDNDLAKDILALNEIKSVKANLVTVQRINKYGFFSGFGWEEKTGTREQKVIKPKEEENTLEPDETFRICTTITDIPATKIEITRMPIENEVVHTPYGEVKLTKELGAGGEAVVYETDTKYVAKIYKKETITVRKYEKIKLMLSKEIWCPGVCYPVAILYNSDNEFVGYLMPKAQGKELQKSVFGPKPLFLKKFPGWKKRDTVELCVTILEKIQYLHDRNIIMGDINPANILVVSPKEVYFVDTDSYQVEDFPCPVGTINYTAPEIQGRHFTDFLRTMGNENFAVATLLFMIMLPGKPPYSQQGGEDPVSNILKMDFSYPFGDNSNKKTPEGPWRYIWSHLTYDLKEAFYNSFRKDGEYSAEDKRLSANEWLMMFRYYLELLDSGKYGQQDKMSEELFPTRLKKNPKSSYVTCKLCSQEVEESQSVNGICRECLKDGEIYKCKKCGVEMVYSNYHKYVKNSKKHDICSECFENSKKVRLRQNCIDCGRIFEITNSQYDYYMQKGMALPKRCKNCIDAKKNNGSYGASYRTYGSYRPTGSRPISERTIGSRPVGERPIGSRLVGERPTGKRPESNGRTFSGSSGGSGCFITTAVCDFYGKTDDCEELTLLRMYRDTWLKEQEDGVALITEYYNNAPYIVRALNSSARYAKYCEILMEEYIKPCVEMIKSGEYQECKNHYIDMVHYMQEILETEM